MNQYILPTSIIPMIMRRVLTNTSFTAAAAAGGGAGVNDGIKTCGSNEIHINHIKHEQQEHLYYSLLLHILVLILLHWNDDNSTYLHCNK